MAYPLTELPAGACFGRWTILGRAPIRRKSHPLQSQPAYWRCRCDCGTEREVAGFNLRNGASTGCGCVRAKRS